MKKFKQIIGWLCLLLLISCSEQRNSAQKITQTELQTGEYSDEVLLHLQSRAQQLQLLFSSTLVINTLKTANQHTKAISPLTEKAYQDIDARMQRKSQTPDVQQLLYNDCAINLKAFRAKHPAFSEIFVTDLSGMNVCQTNMTTDFYQADEAWWKIAYNNGAGKLYFGSIEYDTGCLGAHKRFWDIQVSQNRIASLGVYSFGRHGSLSSRLRRKLRILLRHLAPVCLYGEII